MTIHDGTLKKDGHQVADVLGGIVGAVSNDGVEIIKSDLINGTITDGSIDALTPCNIVCILRGLAAHGKLAGLVGLPQIRNGLDQDALLGGGSGRGGCCRTYGGKRVLGLLGGLEAGLAMALAPEGIPGGLPAFGVFDGPAATEAEDSASAIAALAGFTGDDLLHAAIAAKDRVLREDAGTFAADHEDAPFVMASSSRRVRWSMCWWR